MPNEKDTLFGVAAIRPHVGGASESTIMKWKIEYPTFPIRKLGGVWVANRETLVEWFRNFCLGKVGSVGGNGKSSEKRRSKTK